MMNTNYPPGLNDEVFEDYNKPSDEVLRALNPDVIKKLKNAVHAEAILNSLTKKGYLFGVPLEEMLSREVGLSNEQQKLIEKLEGI